MTTPQDPPVRRKQKARRTKQLMAWRAKNPPATEAKGEPAAKGPSTSTKGPAK